jgi:hypothetical protein
MMADYNIKKEGFIFYFLFALVMIPVQTFIDTLFYNILENFLKVDMFYFLNNFREKFIARKNFWMALEEISAPVEGELKSLVKMCYSSQYYFSITVHLSGQVLMVLGLQIIIATRYNPFSDSFSVLVGIFWLLVAILIHRFTKLIGGLFQIWKIQVPEGNQNFCFSLPKFLS